MCKECCIPTLVELVVDTVGVYSTLCSAMNLYQGHDISEDLRYLVKVARFYADAMIILSIVRMGSCVGLRLRVRARVRVRVRDYRVLLMRIYSLL
jgi:hypothetical protein